MADLYCHVYRCSVLLDTIGLFRSKEFNSDEGFMDNGLLGTNRATCSYCDFGDL